MDIDSAELKERAMRVDHTEFSVSEYIENVIAVYYRGTLIGSAARIEGKITLMICVPDWEYACWGDLGRAVEMAKTMIKEKV
jgi:hypothetical protein